MYTEDYDKNEFPYRSFFIKLIIIISITLMLVWGFSKIFNNDKKKSNEFDENFFYKNLEKMKVAALRYYNEDNIPTKLNESNKVTLKELINSDNIKTIKDKNDNKCNNKESYITITKAQNEYVLKVYLHCGDKNDYSIMHLNHYTYCNETYLCEEQDKEENIEIGEEEPENTDNDNSNVSNNNSNKKSNTTIVTKNTIKKKITTNKSTSNKGTISVIDTTKNNYIYEYKKIENVTFSNWSLWSNWEKVNCFTNSIKCEENDINCLKELKRYNRKESLGTYVKSYDNKRNEILGSGVYAANICSLYDYIEIDKVIYRLPLGDLSKYTVIYNNSLNATNVGNWIYSGRRSYINPPTDSYNTHYILVGPDYSNCDNTCESNPKYVYDKYIYNGSITNVNSYTCATATYKTVPLYTKRQTALHFERTENLYGTVCYKSERTRTLIKKGTTTTKWSVYNDTKLLNSGYIYTGNKKSKK